MQAFSDKISSQMNVATQFLIGWGGGLENFINSWAGDFRKDCTDLIDESLFSDLFSDNPASRPSVPVRWLVASLVLMEEKGLDYEALEDHLTYDLSFRYAIGCDDLPGRPFCAKTLRNFKKKMRDYESRTGIDLMEECFKDTSRKQADRVGTDASKKRMDSFMIESGARVLSRPELFYQTNHYALEELIGYAIQENIMLGIPRELEHYLYKNDRNQVFYHSPEKRTAEALMEESVKLYELCQIYGPEHLGENYLKLERLLEEQTLEEEGVLRLRKDASEGLHSGTMQTPVDPDATYREKAGKSHQGYVGNVVEEKNEETNTSIITDAQFEKNTYSDPQFIEDYIDAKETETEEVIVVDGAYPTSTVLKEAEEKNIEILPTNLPGQATNPIHAKITFDESGLVSKCPAGNTPKSVCALGEDGCSFSMPIEICKACPFWSQCQPKTNEKAKNPRTTRINTSQKAKRRAELLESIDEETARKSACFRNGVETVPSLLRNKYGIDHMHVFGYAQSKQKFYSKIIAANTAKMRRWRKKMRQTDMLKNNEQIS